MSSSPMRTVPEEEQCCEEYPSENLREVEHVVRPHSPVQQAPLPPPSPAPTALDQDNDTGGPSNDADVSEVPPSPVQPVPIRPSSPPPNGQQKQQQQPHLHEQEIQNSKSQHGHESAPTEPSEPPQQLLDLSPATPALKEARHPSPPSPRPPAPIECQKPAPSTERVIDTAAKPEQHAPTCMVSPLSGRVFEEETIDEKRNLSPPQSCSTVGSTESMRPPSAPGTVSSVSSNSMPSKVRNNLPPTAPSSAPASYYGRVYESENPDAPPATPPRSFRANSPCAPGSATAMSAGTAKTSKATPGTPKIRSGMSSVPPSPAALPPTAPFTAVSGHVESHENLSPGKRKPAAPRQHGVAPPISVPVSETWSTSFEDVTAVYAVVATAVNEPVHPHSPTVAHPHDRVWDDEEAQGGRNRIGGTLINAADPFRDRRVQICLLAAMAVIVLLSVVTGVTIRTQARARSPSNVSSANGSSNAASNGRGGEDSQGFLSSSTTLPPLLPTTTAPAVGPGQTDSPTRAPIASTAAGTKSQTVSPSTSPTSSPSLPPTSHPTDKPSASPTKSPSGSPTASPTAPPNAAPSASPSASPTASPSSSPTKMPVETPSPTASTTPIPEAPPPRKFQVSMTGTLQNKHGNMFDLLPYTSIEIEAFDVHLASTGGVIMEVYLKEGPYEGSELVTEPWRRVARAAVEGQGKGTPTRIPAGSFSPIQLKGGVTYGFYITTADKSKVVTEWAPGDVQLRTIDLEFTWGSSITYPFMAFSSYRVWNGAIYYHKVDV